MKKWLLSGFTVFVMIAYMVNQRMAIPVQTASPAGVPVTPTTQVELSSDGIFSDGEYTGVVADAIFGDLQVKAIISKGKLAQVVWLKYPNDRPTSIKINEDAMRPLDTEAIQKQSAQVDNVSGATQTADAYRVSLASALAQAKQSQV